MKIFTIKSGVVQIGAEVTSYKIGNSDIALPAIFVGEPGVGRELGVLPVQLIAEQRAQWEANGKTIIYHADLGRTKAGATKLISTDGSEDSDKAICVFLTKIGFRGGNKHAGDRIDGETETDLLGKVRQKFRPFPGEVICKGIIAQGMAGRMGSGEQLIAVMPKGVVFSTSYRGRLYGEPPEHYYLFDGENILPATWEERLISDIF